MVLVAFWQPAAAADVSAGASSDSRVAGVDDQHWRVRPSLPQGQGCLVLSHLTTWVAESLRVAVVMGRPGWFWMCSIQGCCMSDPVGRGMCTCLPGTYGWRLIMLCLADGRHLRLVHHRQTAFQDAIPGTLDVPVHMPCAHLDILLHLYHMNEPNDCSQITLLPSSCMAGVTTICSLTARSCVVTVTSAPI